MPINRLFRWRDLPLATKLAFFFIASTLTALVALAFMEDTRARAQVIAQSRVRNLQQARATTQLLDFYLASVDANVQLIAIAPGTLVFLTDPQHNTHRDEINQVLQLARDRGGYDAAFLLDPYGAVLIATDPRLVGRNYTTASWFRNAAAGQSTFDEPRYDATDGKMYLHVSAPITTPRGEIVGAAVVRLTLEPIDNIMATDVNYDGLGASGVLADENGIRLSQSIRQDLRYKPFAPLSPDLLDQWVFEARFGPDTATILNSPTDLNELVRRSKLLLYDDQTDPYLTVNLLSSGPADLALAPLKNKRWVYSVGTPQANLLAKVNQQTQMALLQALGIGLLALVVSFAGARWVTRPIRRVAESANAIAAGDLSRRIGLNQRDEVGKLATAFDAMAESLAEKDAQLRGYAAELEQKVQARTAALGESEARLRRIVEGTDAMLVNVDRRGNFTYVNEAAARGIGYEQKALLGKNYLDFVHPADRNRVRRAFIEQVGTRRESAALEFRIVTAGGQIKWMRFATNLIIENDRVAGETGVALEITERKRAEEQLEQRANEFAVLYEITRDLAAQQDLPALLRIIAERAATLLSVPYGSVYLYNAARQDLELVVSKDPAFPIGARLKLGEGMAGRVALTREPLIVDDYHAWEHRSTQYAVAPYTATIEVPMLYRGEIVGVLVCYTVELPVRHFIDAETRLLSLFASQAASAVHNARLLETEHEQRKLAESLRAQTEQQLQRLSVLRNIDVAISSSLDVQLTLRILLEQITTQLGFDAADVFLMNPHMYMLDFAAGRGFRTTARQQSHLRLGVGLAGRAALERRVVHIPYLRESENDLADAPGLASEGFTTYYAAPLITKGQVKGVLEIFHRAPHRSDPEWLGFLEALAAQVAIAIENAEMFNHAQHSSIELAMAYDTTLEGWSRALDMRDKEPEGHTRRVAEMTEQLAHAMGMSDEQIVHVRRGTLLHDIGKMGVPDAILLKPGPLTDDEWVWIRKHPQLAYEMLAPIAYLKPALDIPYCHHEKWDGTGYPRQLKGEQIPLAARVFAVVDVWDALTSERSFRKAWTNEKTLEHIRSLSGTHFDPRVVQVFWQMDIYK